MPAGLVATTVRVLASTFDTVLSALLATQTYFASATASVGSMPVGIEVSSSFEPGSITASEFGSACSASPPPLRPIQAATTAAEQQGSTGRQERARRASPDRGDAGRRGGAIELRVLAQDRPLESLQLGSRLETELVRRPPSALAIGLESIGLTSGAIEREHQLPLEALARGVRP